jgi:hypothetical protein
VIRTVGCAELSRFNNPEQVRRGISMLERSSLPYFRPFAGLRDFTFAAVRKVSFQGQAAENKSGTDYLRNAQATVNKNTYEDRQTIPPHPQNGEVRAHEQAEEL